VGKQGSTVIHPADSFKSLPEVVITGLFSLFLLRKHFITEIFFKKKSGDVNDEANFSLFILLQERAKPILPPYPHPHPPPIPKPFTPPLPTPSPPRALSLWLNRVKDSTNLYSPLTSIPKPSPIRQKHGARIEQKNSLQHATL